MKTEKQIINELGEWLCRDMEKDIVMENERRGLPSIADMEKIIIVQDVARRIHWYIDNVIDKPAHGQE